MFHEITLEISLKPLKKPTTILYAKPLTKFMTNGARCCKIVP